MKKHTFLLLIIAFLLTACGQTKDIKSFEAMNTFMTVQAYGKNAKKAKQLIKQRIEVLEDFFSTTKINSDVYKLNNSQETETVVHPETFEILQFALKMANETSGALNPCLYNITSAWGFTTGSYRVPSQDEISFLLKRTDFNHLQMDQERSTVTLETGMQVDFGAVGKGYAGDQAIKILKEQGVKSAILDLGGNIQTLGTKPDGSEWKVGIKSPFGGRAVAGVKVCDKAVITSGGYERFFTADDGNSYIHIFDGKTGRPVKNEIASVTIICESGLYGDSLSTALFVMGTEKAVAYWKTHREFEFIIITIDEDLIYTKGLESKIQLLEDFESVTVIE